MPKLFAQWKLGPQRKTKRIVLRSLENDELRAQLGESAVSVPHAPRIASDTAKITKGIHQTVKKAIFDENWQLKQLRDQLQANTITNTAQII